MVNCIKGFFLSRKTTALICSHHHDLCPVEIGLFSVLPVFLDIRHIFYSSYGGAWVAISILSSLHIPSAVRSVVIAPSLIFWHKPFLVLDPRER